MNTSHSIIDSPLPLSQDFKYLKEKALAYIQNNIGSEWTNFNPSDPGVTIMDQFCYALTELGYCTDFSIPDILTNVDGKLTLEDQFYLPSEIFTTAAVTLNDYIKYLIDGVEWVNNAYIIPYINTILPLNRVYQVYLLIDPVIDTDEQNKVCDSAFYYLNKSRNLGEVFMKPIALQPKNCWIGGEIQLENTADQYTVLLQLQNKIRDYIFPKVKQTSYGKLMEEGYPTSKIFSGPYLNNGGILSDSLVNKKNLLRTIDLIPLIESVPGITSISNITLYQDKNPVPVLQSDIDQVLYINLVESLQTSLFLTFKGENLSFDPSRLESAVMDFSDQETKLPYGKKEDKHSQLPHSTFRDINTYYSIQNTFPAVFAVGTDTVSTNATPLQIAQSRQLKGYLTLYDQILANQFSQLANVPKLFSFKNSVSGDPSDEYTFYAVKNQSEQKQLEYPVPYKMFSPSYFYQSLYTVPHIRYLLKNNTTFDFSSKIEPDAELEEKSWIEYQQNPYNSYLFGLMKLMEDDTVNFSRRNKLLDHLLARHGEAAVVIDMFIEAVSYTGDKEKDKLIFKSLYLQNISLLSYNRYKAHNYLGANKITYSTEKQGLDLDNNATDYIFKSEMINRREKLDKDNFVNYSGLELKLNLLFGLKNQYLNFIAVNYTKSKDVSEKPQYDENYRTVQQALWLTQKRRGCILIEPILLLKDFHFDIIITKDTENGPYYSIDNLDYETATKLIFLLSNEAQNILDNQLQQGNLDYANTTYIFTKRDMVPDKSGFKSCKSADYSLFLSGESANQKICLKNKLFEKNIILIFPDFIPQLHTNQFKDYLDFFMTENLPVSVSYKCLFLSSNQLEHFIPEFINWHESMRHSITKSDPAQYATDLINSLTDFFEALK